MSKIRVMNELLANKIAAGEVVEKCSSVLKELVENSIDAGATNIKVLLDGGGLKKIEVIDDGSGMDREDASLAFCRHATSKIYKDDDLFFIETLGFRGEALASIASVSEVNMETSNGVVGTLVHIKGGKVLEVSDAPLRVGTKIEVTNIFYNTPARLKYLKTEGTELNNCLAYIEKLALSKPDIAFSLSNNDKVLVKTSGSNNLLKTIHEIYGLNVSSNMLELKAMNDDYEISGYVSKPSILKKNRNHFNTFVNGRIVRNIDINRAINDAYNTYKHEGFYPIVVINIETDPTLVDVNIHPTKQDIKLSKMDELYDLIYKNIKGVLYKNLLVASALVNEEDNDIKNNFIEPSVYEKIDTSNETLEIPWEEETIQTSLDFGTNEVIKNEEFKSLKLYPVGQVHGTYIICENEDGMYIVDQHAAHERVNYEMITKRYQDEEVTYTDMLVPLSIELSTSDYTLFQERKSVLTDLGFKIEDFGINTICIKSHPTWLRENYEQDNIKYIVDLVLENKNFNKDRFLDSLAKMVSCKMSVKANEHLSLEQMEKLLNDLVKCDNPYNCCHGRPSIMKFSNYELEKMFRRVL